MAAKLDVGGVVADLGCGVGVAVVALAERFPRSHIHGFDISRHAIERARQLVEDAEVDNLTLHLAGADTLPAEATFDLVLTLDCLHDMTEPTETMAAIRRSIRSDGTWLVKGIRCTPRARDNIANPMAAMMYGFSIASCMSSALSEPEGAGLGTLGLHPELLARLSAEAGFGQFEIHDFDEPANLYCEVRVG